jgi:hypothetical protein
VHGMAFLQLLRVQAARQPQALAPEPDSFGRKYSPHSLKMLLPVRRSANFLQSINNRQLQDSG